MNDDEFDVLDENQEIIDNFFTTDNIYIIGDTLTFQIILIIVSILIIYFYSKIINRKYFSHLYPNQKAPVATKAEEKKFKKMKQYSQKFKISIPNSEFNTYQDYLNYKFEKDKKIKEEDNEALIHDEEAIENKDKEIATFGAVMVICSVLTIFLSIKIFQDPPKSIEVLDEYSFVLKYTFKGNIVFLKEDITHITSKKIITRTIKTNKEENLLDKIIHPDICLVNIYFKNDPEINTNIKSNDYYIEEYGYKQEFEVSKKEGYFPQCPI